MRSSEELIDFCFSLVKQIHESPGSGFERPEFTDERTVEFFLVGELALLARIEVLPSIDNFCRLRLEVECGNAPCFSAEQWHVLVTQFEGTCIGEVWASGQATGKIDTLLWGTEQVVYGDEGVDDLVVLLLEHGATMLQTVVPMLVSLEPVSGEEFIAASQLLCMDLPTLSIN